MAVDIFIMILYSAYAMSDDSPFLTKRKRDWSADISVFSKGRKPFPDLCIIFAMTGFSLTSQVSCFLKKNTFSNINFLGNGGQETTLGMRCQLVVIYFITLTESLTFDLGHMFKPLSLKEKHFALLSSIVIPPPPLLAINYIHWTETYSEGFPFPSPSTSK